VTILAEKRIILGVTGSIAAYKAVAVASQLTQAGARVDVIMTEAATRFVTPLTFQALTGRPVYTSLWGTDSGGMETHIAHVGLAHEADLLLIAPITAQSIARLAHGLADDLLSVTALAARCPVVIAPAMDVGMYEAPATQANLDVLRERGVTIAGPTVGRMASGFEGPGRLIEPEEIVGHCRYALGQGGQLAGRRVVVSAGPTQEPLDPVRYLTNYSSGRQGFALAQAAVDAGAEVTLISGPARCGTRCCWRLWPRGRWMG
jgi:phosphopantothenoylcysteine decarboxylase/phosphopantothenate--cysteine ligase